MFNKIKIIINFLAFFLLFVKISHLGPDPLSKCGSDPDPQPWKKLLNIGTISYHSYIKELTTG